MREEGSNKRDKKRLAHYYMGILINDGDQLVEETQSREAAKTKCLLQVKAQQAFQEWKQKKSEAEREKKHKERREMQQRREAESKVIFYFMNLLLNNLL